MLRPFFDWFQELAFAIAFRASTWMFPVVDAVHLLALVVFAGAILLVDLRLLGVMKDRPATQVSRDATPWLLGSIAVLFVSGTLMIMGNGDKYYYSDYFWQKIAVLAVGMVYTFTIRRKVIALSDDGRMRPFLRRASGMFSICLWSFVAVWGRLIGLLS